MASIPSDSVSRHGVQGESVLLLLRVQPVMVGADTSHEWGGLERWSGGVDWSRWRWRGVSASASVHCVHCGAYRGCALRWACRLLSMGSTSRSKQAAAPSDNQGGKRARSLAVSRYRWLGRAVPSQSTCSTPPLLHAHLTQLGFITAGASPRRAWPRLNPPNTAA
jgi:hypothetical protein